MMNLKLEKPLAFFDLETTGVNMVSDRIVSLCINKVFPDGTEELREAYFNPGIPIPPEATAVHGITDEMVKGMPFFKDVAVRIHNYISDCDFGGHNIGRFDIPFLAEEFARCGLEFPIPNSRIFDSYVIITKMHPKDLSACLSLYLGEKMEDAHNSTADTIAAKKVFNAQIGGYYEEITKMSWDELAAFCKMGNNVDLAGKFIKNDKGIIVFTFGKHINKPVVQAFTEDPGYNKWIQSNDFTQNTKSVSQKLFDYVQSKNKK